MKIIISTIILFCVVVTSNAQNLQLDSFLDKAEKATQKYKETFKNLVAEELKTFETYRKDGSLDDSRKIKSYFIVFQSQIQDRVLEYRNIVEFNGRNVARQDEDVVDFYEKLTKASTIREQYKRLIKEGNRYDGKTHVNGFTLHQGFCLQTLYRPFFDFRVAGKEKIGGRDVLVVEYVQTKPSPFFKLNPTLEEMKQESRGVVFESLWLASKFIPAYPRITGKIWLDIETAQIWRDEYQAAIQPKALSEPAIALDFKFEYQSSDFSMPVPKKYSVVWYRLDGKSDSSEKRVIAAVNTFEYAKFSKPDSEIKDTKIDKK